MATEIWSIKRHVWIEGPYLPSHLDGCVYHGHSCGVSINRTHGILLYHQLNWQNYHKCIDAIIFSVETFEWVVIQKCIINFTNPIDVVKFTCSSYLNKSGKM